MIGSNHCALCTEQGCGFSCSGLKKVKDGTRLLTLLKRVFLLFLENSVDADQFGLGRKK